MTRGHQAQLFEGNMILLISHTSDLDAGSSSYALGLLRL